MKVQIKRNVVIDKPVAVQTHTSKRSFQKGCFSYKAYSDPDGMNTVLTMGAPGVAQLVGATCGIQFAPPVSFFSLCESLKEFKCRIQVKIYAINVTSISVFLGQMSKKKERVCKSND